MPTIDDWLAARGIDPDRGPDSAHDSMAACIEAAWYSTPPGGRICIHVHEPQQLCQPGCRVVVSPGME